MSALAEEEFSPYRYDLSVAGVALAPQQHALLEESRHRPRKALTVGFVNEPREPRFPFAADCMDDDGTYSRWHVPAVVDLRPEYWAQARPEEAPFWRYPTAPGALLQHSDYGDVFTGDVEGFRAYLLWPITVADADCILAAGYDYLLEHLLPRRALAACDTGDSEVCDAYTEATGTLPEHHRHTTGDFWMCEDGEHWLEHTRQQYMRLDHDGDLIWYPLPPMPLPPDLAALYDDLVESSRATAWRLHNALPAWERDTVARTERHYVPWLS